jgi:ribosome-associated toxin RatA of RatAB toxin-antitoxin module
LSRPRSIVVEAIDSIIFKELKSHWTFQSGPTPGSCWLEFKVEFCFRSPIYNQVASMFLDEVIKKMMASFEKRCEQLYGERSAVGGAAYT